MRPSVGGRTLSSRTPLLTICPLLLGDLGGRTEVPTNNSYIVVFQSTVTGYKLMCTTELSSSPKSWTERHYIGVRNMGLYRLIVELDLSQGVRSERKPQLHRLTSPVDDNLYPSWLLKIKPCGTGFHVMCADYETLSYFYTTQYSFRRIRRPFLEMRKTMTVLFISVAKHSRCPPWLDGYYQS
jgi:hypothetical protein